jgi:hypothetical protein
VYEQWEDRIALAVLVAAVLVFLVQLTLREN